MAGGANSVNQRKCVRLVIAAKSETNLPKMLVYIAYMHIGILLATYIAYVY